MLDGVLGAGRALVRVTADLNFQQLERTSETYDPNSPSVRSEERSKVTNAVADKSDEAAESTEDASEENTITNYELNKTVEHIINAVGGVDRLSLAVMVDGTYNEVETADGVESIYQPRPQEELDRLAAIVKNAVGFDPQRNDQIEIVNIAFDRRDLVSDQEALDSMYMRDFYIDLSKKIGLVLLILIGLLYLKKEIQQIVCGPETARASQSAGAPAAAGTFPDDPGGGSGERRAPGRTAREAQTTSGRSDAESSVGSSR